MKSMNPSRLTGLKLFVVICSLLFLSVQPAHLFAAPSLLLDINGKQTTAMDLPAGSSTAFALNFNLLKQLRQEKIAELSLPVGGSIVLFKLKKQYIRDQTVTWQGSDESGNIHMVFTMGKNHLYGRVVRGSDVFIYTPDPLTGNIMVKQLDPQNEVELDNDSPPVPDERLPMQAPAPAADDVVAAADADDGSRIDVMVLYTNGMAAAHPGNAINTRIQYLVDQANESFDNSNINTHFNLVHTQEVIYPDDSPGDMDEALHDLTYNNGVFTGVEALRTTYGADQVVLLRRFVDEGCGYAWVLKSASPRNAYAVVHDGSKTDGSGSYCTDLTYVHEIGHNLGCAHDRANAGSGGRYSYSYGYQQPQETFRTVMAYDCAGGCPRVSHFSNPDVLYNGQPTGIDQTAADSADNARTINQTRFEMAAYRQEVAKETKPILAPVYLLLL